MEIGSKIGEGAYLGGGACSEFYGSLMQVHFLYRRNTEVIHAGVWKTCTMSVTSNTNKSETTLLLCPVSRPACICDSGLIQASKCTVQSTPGLEIGDRRITRYTFTYLLTTGVLASCDLFTFQFTLIVQRFNLSEIAIMTSKVNSYPISGVCGAIHV